MINGFIIEIVNTGESEEAITLFRDRGIPKSIQIRVVNADYDYASLLAMAKTKGFVGSGISTNFKGELQVMYNKGHQAEHLLVGSILADKQINLDGNTSYLSLTVPASGAFIFQLVPLVYM